MRVYRTPIQTEATAWQYVADRLEEQGSKLLQGAGLCHLIFCLSDQGIIAWQVQCAMEERVEREVIALNGGKKWTWGSLTPAEVDAYQHYLFPKGRSVPRILLAQFYALEAADEARAKARERAKERKRIAALDDVGAVHLGADELEEIEQIASRDEDDDSYIARCNAIPEAATFEEIESGAGTDGYDLDTRKSNAAPW